MITSIQEHDEWHLNLVDTVVVLKVLFDLGLHSTEVFNLSIDASLNINAIHEVTEDDSLSVKDVFFLAVKLALCLVDEQVVNELAIWVVRKTITEDTFILVDPESEKLCHRSGILLVYNDTATEDLGDISQVESIVTLVWRWLERSIEHIVVDFKLCLDQWVDALLNVTIEVLVEGLQDRLEDRGDSLESHLSITDDVELTLHTLGDNGATTSWRSHSGDQDDIDESVEGLLLRLSVVPATVIGELTKKLDGWLSSILLLHWHVEVIDEDDEPLAVWWSVHSQSTLLTLVVDEVLSLVGRSLSGEGNLKSLVLLRHLKSREFLNVHTLTGTSWTWSQDVFHVLDEKLNEVLHSDGVLSGHDDLIVWNLGVDLVLRNSLEPRLIFLGLLVPVEVVNRLALLLWIVELLGLHLITDPFVEAFSSKLSGGGTK